MISKTITFALTASLLTLAACDGEGGDTIGPDGGEVISDDGKLTLTIEPDALDREVFVTIGAIDDCADNLDVCYEIEPFGTMLARPATLTYEFDPETMTRVNVDNLTLISEREEGWGKIADLEIDAETNTISGHIVSFSAYTISLAY